MKNIKDLLKENDIDHSEEILNALEESESSIKLPLRLVFDLQKALKGSDLINIHSDRDTALELIYILLSNFTFAKLNQAYYKKDFINNNYMNLSSVILKEQTGTNSRYKKIINLMIDKKFIESGTGYKPGTKSNSYKIADKYFTFRVEKYKLRTDYAIKLLKQNRRKFNTDLFENTIAKSELLNSNFIELPTRNDVLKELKKYSKNKWVNKKGKQLKILGKKKRLEQYVYVEDYLELYELLVDHFKLPRILSDNAGGRVMTKYNTIPSIIRKLIKIDGKQLVGLDFSCFQPNLANRIFGEELDTPLSHQEAADYLSTLDKYKGLDEEELLKLAKTEHLSFFNLKVQHLKKSKLYNFYENNHPTLLKNIIAEKETNGYKSVSKKMFITEVRMMTEIVNRCMESGIIVVYVYDELMCEQEFVNDVRDIMKEVCEEQKLNVKIK